MPGLWAAVRGLRYALPRHLERALPGPGPRTAARGCRALNRRGQGATIGYFQSADAEPEDEPPGNRSGARGFSGVP